MIKESLSFKISIKIMILVVASGVLVNFLTYQMMTTVMEEYVKKQLQNEAHFVAISMSTSLWTFNQQAVATTGKYLMEQKGEIEMLAVEVLDDKGKKIFSQRKESVTDERLHAIHYTEKDIFYEDEKIGQLRIWTDSSQLRLALNKITNLLTLATFLVTIFIAIWVFFSLKRMLSKPLQKIQNSARSVLNGDLRSRIDENIDSEFLYLVQAYNKMFDEIERRDSDLRSYNQNLEQTVVARTQEADEQRALLMQASRMATLGEFAGNVAHEINNPLAVIQGNAQIIGRVLATPNEGVSIEKIEKSKDKIILMVDRIGKIISGLRSFARDGSRDPMVPFELKKMFEVILDLSSRKLESRGIALRFECSAVDRFVMGREVQFSQVIMNLINNASDAIEHLSDKWIEIGCYIEGDFLLIAITDSGHGIPKEIREKMMNPFFTTKEVGKGTGLGLSISMGIIKEHHGEIYYDEASSHTRFCIKIPRFQENRKAG